ncbi:MAG: hypothetical protein LUE87_04680, partial [Lachnospiraceae bacterium]|nr:hypothetical protein [Lachnospiraceae bacterium]
FSWAVPVCFLLGFSVPAYVQAILYSRIFDKIENPETEEEEKNEEGNPEEWSLEENPDGEGEERTAAPEALTVDSGADITAQKTEDIQAAE